MAKPSLAFIDHELHQKTRSSEFMRDILREHFDVHDYWDASWRGGPTVPPEEINKHDHAFFLQVLNPFSEIKHIHIPMTWAPMYDSYKPTYAYWKAISYFNIQVLSFSKKMAARMQECRIPVMTVQYYYLKPERAPRVSGNHVFFWYRGDITFNDLRPVLDPDQIDGFTLLEAPDKNGTVMHISPEDITNYKINRITGFLPREQFLELVRKASIFVAPRRKEGIGTFTEPLAMGKAVLAYDEGVQNEYITHGVDGFLFDERSGVLNLDTVTEISDAAYRRAEKGYKKWLVDRGELIPFMLAPHRPPQRNTAFAYWYMLYRWHRLIGSLKYIIRNRLREPMCMAFGKFK